LYTANVNNMGSHTVSTEHVISMYWNVCLMMVTVTETCSSFTLLNILLCFEWTTFWLVVQHDGLAPIKYLLRHVCLSVWPSSWNNSTTTGRIFTKFCYFSKIYPEYSSFKCGKNNGYFTRRPVYTNDKILRNSSLVWEMIQTKAVEKIQPHISRSETPPPPFTPPKIVPFVRYDVKKIRWSQTCHRWRCITAHAPCMLDT